MVSDRDKTVTGGLIGGHEEYEARQREKLIYLLSAFTDREAMAQWVYDTKNQNDTIRSLNLTVNDLRDRVNELEDFIEIIEESRDRKLWLAQNVKMFVMFFLPLATLLTVLWNGWGTFLQYLRGE